MTIQEYDAWFIKNLSRLLVWFDAPGAMKPVYFSSEAKDMQVFREPIRKNVLTAVKDLKIELLKAAIFGREQKIADPSGNTVYSFSGFFEQIGRLPKANEYCVFMARQWFELCEIQKSDALFYTHVDSAVGEKEKQTIPAIGCECYIKVIAL